MTAKPRKTPPLSVIVLAAGQGQRMKSVLPKVLQPLAGLPADRARHRCRQGPESGAHPRGARPRRRAGAHRGARPEPALGAAEGAARHRHAVLQAMPAVPDGAVVLVLYGDVPLIRTGDAP